MCEKSTQDLNRILGKTHTTEFDEFLEQHQATLIQEDNPLGLYLKKLIKKRKLTQQIIFARADIPEKYGYKLLSGEKRTQKRDTILKLCYAAELSLEETQKALKLYSMPELYAKIPRDALIMIIFNQRPNGIITANELLEHYGFDPFKTSGAID